MTLEQQTAIMDKVSIANDYPRSIFGDMVIPNTHLPNSATTSSPNSNTANHPAASSPPGKNSPHRIHHPNPSLTTLASNQVGIVPRRRRAHAQVRSGIRPLLLTSRLPMLLAAHRRQVDSHRLRKTPRPLDETARSRSDHRPVRDPRQLVRGRLAADDVHCTSSSISTPFCLRAEGQGLDDRLVAAHGVLLAFC